MSNAAAVFDYTETGGSFSPVQCQGVTPKKFVVANLDIAGDYQTGGVDISEIADFFSVFMGVVPINQSGYIMESVASTQKLKLMLPSQAHVHAVTLDGGATNYPSQSQLDFHGSGTLTTSATKYIGAQGVESATAAAATAKLITKAGFLRAMYVDLATAPGSGKTYTVTVNINGVDSTMTVSIAGTNKTGNDTTHNAIAVAAGDRIVLKSVNDDGAAAGLGVAILYEITAGAIGILTTDAATGSAGSAGVAVELSAGVTLALTDIPVIAFGI